ncbi:MFS transporter [Candidatus Bathyarchaeota archaeon]|nr:MFS transporter [Candidatus Bathyarchaeota archaeon]MBT4320716.1 MFS transporter [Candidatus Bathyarchaeota archaeon]MBT4424277.1 MFS transporter [Candidatus Bathyarchaeota archaeon]MBT5641539.1 MFS transporter [Candidatus Bathyarchaeota archaeon]MBT6604252.1 MFS transporter [Candidatus Bathyarchaeota archaeon]
MGLKTKLGNVYYGYWVLFGAIILHFLDSGLYFYGFSVFYTPIRAEFGWSAAVVAGAISFSRLEGGIEGPLIGYLIKRFGPRKIIAIGVVLTGIGYMAMIFVDSPLMLYLVYAGVLSIGYNMGFTHGLSTLITNWFIKKRTRALSLYALGAGIGGAVVVPLISKSMVLYGWRTTAILCGLSFWVVGLPAAYLFRNSPEEMGLLPDGERSSEYLNAEDGESPAVAEPEISTRDALKSVTFRRLLLAESLRTFLLGSIVLHQIPHLVNIGLSAETAGGILGMMIFASIPGRGLFGLLGDRIKKNTLLAATMITQGIGVLILAFASNIIHVYAFVVIYGLTYGGCIPLMMAFRGDIFGRKNFAQMSGIMSPFRMIGNVVGPVLAGYLFDVTGSYRVAFIAFAALAAMSGISFYFVKSDRL